MTILLASLFATSAVAIDDGLEQAECECFCVHGSTSLIAPVPVSELLVSVVWISASPAESRTGPAHTAWTFPSGGWGIEPAAGIA